MNAEGQAEIASNEFFDFIHEVNGDLESYISGDVEDVMGWVKQFKRLSREYDLTRCKKPSKALTDTNQRLAKLCSPFWSSINKRLFELGKTSSEIVMLVG